MTDARDATSSHLTRRETMIGAGAALLGSTATARAQTGTPTGGEAQISRMAVIPEVGQPFAGNYVGQFVIFTDPSPGDDVPPDGIAQCDAADWAPEETRDYQVLIVDRLTDDPQGVTVQAFLDGTAPRIEVGNAYIVQRTHPCPGGFLTLELEDVPVRTFAPDRGTANNPLVGESPGPTVPGTAEQTETGEPGAIDGPGQPGFGALSALAGLGVAAWLRRARRQSERDR